MGRDGGKNGKLLAEHIAGGGWRKQSYGVRREPLARNHNWFLIGEFIVETVAD
jgi:hypothetical protein